MSISSELKKLCCRLTGESNTAAIDGNSISEVLGYMAENLNVNANGNLIVSEYKEPVSPSEPSGGNLLKSAYKCAELWNADNQGIVGLDSVGLVLGKFYKATGYYGGESLGSDEGATRFELTAQSFDAGYMFGENAPEGLVGLMYEVEVSEAYSGTINFNLMDGAYVDMSSGEPVADSTKAVLMCGYSGADGGRPFAKNFVLESIVEVEVVNLLSSPVTVVANSNPGFVNIPKLGLELGKKYKITYSYGGVESTVERTCIDSVTSPDNFDIDGCYTLGNMGADAIVITNSDGSNAGFMFIGDSVAFYGESPVASSTQALIMAITGTEELLPYDVVVNSITEA